MVETSFTVHSDMNIYMGAILSLGKVAMYHTSVRQKLNTQSSTEAELVGVDDVETTILWRTYVLEAQGYIANTYILQDN